MSMKNNQNNYGSVAQFFHWAIALLIFWAIAMGKIAEEMPFSPEKVDLFVLHKSAGITVLILVVMRLAWRFISPPPKLGLDAKQEKLAHLGHWALYGLMIALPISGWLLTSAAGYPFAWFHLISVPNLPVGEELKGLFGEIHEVLFYIIAAAIIGHVAMLIHHKKAQGKSYLPRMLPGQKMAAGVILLLILCGLLGYTVLSSRVAPTAIDKVSDEMVVPKSPTAIVGQSNSPLWQPTEGTNKLAFKGRYSGEPFDGEFKSFAPKLYFDPSAPESGIFDVTINTTTVTTYTSDWDSTLSGRQWFAFSQYMQAQFYSDNIKESGEGFVAEGTLSLKGVSQPVALSFTWQEQDTGAVLFMGQATLDRRDFNIGSGEWLEDDCVGFDVNIAVSLTLAKSDS